MSLKRLSVTGGATGAADRAAEQGAERATQNRDAGTKN